MKTRNLVFGAFRFAAFALTPFKVHRTPALGGPKRSLMPPVFHGLGQHYVFRIRGFRPSEFWMVVEISQLHSLTSEGSKIQAVTCWKIDSEPPGISRKVRKFESRPLGPTIFAYSCISRLRHLDANGLVAIGARAVPRPYEHRMRARTNCDVCVDGSGALL
jgi:hypothetical protein